MASGRSLDDATFHFYVARERSLDDAGFALLERACSFNAPSPETVDRATRVSQAASVAKAPAAPLAKKNAAAPPVQKPRIDDAAPPLGLIPDQAARPWSLQ